jgi:hypothetical protein
VRDPATTCRLQSACIVFLLRGERCAFSTTAIFDARDFKFDGEEVLRDCRVMRSIQLRRSFASWQLAIVLATLACLVMECAPRGWAQSSVPVSTGAEKIIIDTDIGDDIDDAFALALALKSPELQVLGIMTGFGDTEARAKIADRFLGETGHTEIPVLAGRATNTKNPMSQRGYGES